MSGWWWRTSRRLRAGLWQDVATTLRHDVTKNKFRHEKKTSQKRKKCFVNKSFDRALVLMASGFTSRVSVNSNPTGICKGADGTGHGVTFTVTYAGC